MTQPLKKLIKRPINKKIVEPYRRDYRIVNISEIKKREELIDINEPEEQQQ